MSSFSADPLDDVFQLAKEKSLANLESQVIELLKPYLKERPEDFRAWMLYGEALGVVGRFTDAVEVWRTLLERAPGRFKAKANCALAMLYQKFHCPAEAKPWFELATGADAVDGAWVLRGANHALLEDYSEALRCFSVALTLDTEEHEEALLNTALVYRAMGDYPNAVKFAEEVLAAYPDSEEAFALLKEVMPIVQGTISGPEVRLH